jgi:lysozyme family protein
LDYQPFIDRVIDRYEGGYGWDTKDPGGPTKYGITCYDLAEHRGQTMTSMSTWAPFVKAMSRQEAEDIYHTKYATGVQFDYLNPGCDTVLLDYGINSGDSRPIRVARALLKLPAGATMTPDLVAAINKADANWFINAVCNERLHFMHQIRGGSAWAEFGHGWGARVADLQTYSVALAKGRISQNIPPPAEPIPSGPKANHTDPQVATKSTKGTVAGGAAAGTAAHASGLPHWAVGLVVAGVIVSGVAYAIYKNRANTAANHTVVLPTTIPPQPVKA